MVYRPVLWALLHMFCFAMSSATAQMDELWPRLERPYITHFYEEEDAYSQKCFADIFFDHQGRLCLIPCGIDILINSVGLFRFDGYSFQPVMVFNQEGACLRHPGSEP